MAFTYTDTLLTDRDWIRFTIGDVVEDSGPKPDSTNFSDNEIAAIVADEGTAGRAAAKLCEVLATMWASEAGEVKMADFTEAYTERAEMFLSMARELRKQHGGAVATPVQVAPTRVDGFSNDIDASES